MEILTLARAQMVDGTGGGAFEGDVRIATPDELGAMLAPNGVPTLWDGVPNGARAGQLIRY